MMRRDVRDPDQARARAELIAIIGFMLAIGLPGATLLAPAHGSRMQHALGEARVAFPILRLSYRSLVTFPSSFRGYFQSNFGGRKALIRYHAKLKAALGLSSSPRVIVGWQGWLYYADEGETDCCRNAVPLMEGQLESWRTTLEARREWLAARGIRFLFVVAPDKHTIYPEFLPPNMRPVRKASRLDQLMCYLREHSTVEAVDLRPALREAKKGGVVYCRLDTHWNGLGAFIAHQEILRTLRQWFPAVPAPRLETHRLSTETRRGGDLARMLGLGADLQEVCPVVKSERHQARIVTGSGDAIRDPSALIEVIVSEKRNGPIPRAVILRDSFCTDLLPLLSEDFGRVVYLWGAEFNPETILRERPNVVIWEMIERSLMEAPPTPPIGATAPEPARDPARERGWR